MLSNSSAACGDNSEMFYIIARNPGLSSVQIGQMLGVYASVIKRKLVWMESHGYLVWENDRGGLYAWRIVPRCRRFEIKRRNYSKKGDR